MKTSTAKKFIFCLLGVMCLLAFGASLCGAPSSEFVECSSFAEGCKVVSDFLFAGSSGYGVAFALTGFARACGKKSSGVRSLYLNESANVTAHTLDGTNERKYSAITHSSAFVKYDFEPDQCEFKETTTFENGSFKNTIEIIFRMGKMSPEISDAIMEMADATYCGMEGVVVDNSGNQWYVGYNEEQKDERPLKLGGSEGTTGKALSDESGDTVTLICETTEKAYTYSGEISALLT